MTENNSIILAMVPVSGVDTDIAYFKNYVVNLFDLTLKIEFHLLKERQSKPKNITVSPSAYGLLPDIWYGDLNDTLILKISFFDELDSELDHWGKEIKLKPKLFLSPAEDVPLIHKKGFIFSLDKEVRKIKTVQSKKNDKPFKIDTDLLKESMMGSGKGYQKTFSSIGSMEVDLHIENLIGNHSGMSNAEIIIIQLEAFEQAMQEAIIAGSDRLYAIHGIGTGKLKQEISRLLKNYPQVRSYNNSYQHKYGFGATEIIFK